MIALAISPSGHLHCHEICPANEPEANPESVTIVDAFLANLGKGLFSLACYKYPAELSPIFRYWREFSNTYMTSRCRSTPGNIEDGQFTPLAPLAFTLLPEHEKLLGSIPPMRGAEYLSLSVFENTWTVLDNWLCEQVNASHQSLDDFLQHYAPQWHQVGRVCLHLAENKHDNDYPFAFMATYISELNQQGVPKHQPLGHALKQFTGAQNKQQLIRLLSPVHHASQHSTLIKELIDAGDIYHPLAWKTGEAYQFIKEIPQYEISGLSIKLPDWWKKRSRPRISVRIGNTTKQKLNTSALLDFNISKTLGDQPLSQSEWDELMAAEEGLLFFKGQWVEVDKEKLSEALNHWQRVEQSVAKEGLSFAEGMRLLAGAPIDLKPDQEQVDTSIWSFVQAGPALDRLLDQLCHPSEKNTTLLDNSLHTTLRQYQQQGVDWLWTLSQLKLGACLADDMGLGKTIQVISLLLILKKRKVKKTSLLILPASLLTNWKDEMNKFAPSLRCIFVHPSQNSSFCLKKENIIHHDLVITTYGMLLRQVWLQECQWQLVILDEAQAIKNPGARQTKAVKQLNAESRIVLTGTPVENHLTDLWSLFDFICPGLLGSAKRFQAFTKSLATRKEDPYSPLRKLVQPYILRRLKTDKSIISDLPDKTEVNTYYHLTKRQAAHYEKGVSELTMALNNAEGIRRKGLVLSYLLRFKQLCNHPSQWLGNGDYRPHDSGKFLRLGALCDEIASRQEKVLVFSQFREMMAPLAEFLSTCFDRSGLILHGGTPVAQRKKIVDSFQQETGPPFFVLSLKAGGIGLNLTQASHVIHFDRWWNPAVENQATDRAFRIGQKRKVLVHKMVCRGTIEEKIDKLITEKNALAQDILTGSAGTLLTEMSNEALINLVSLDVNQIDP